MRGMIELVYFDAGGTLLDPYPSVGAVYAQAGRRHGLSASATDLELAFRENWRPYPCCDGRTYVARAGNELLSMGLDDEKTRTWWRGLDLHGTLRLTAQIARPGVGHGA